MSVYIIRLRLETASQKDFRNLHQALEREEFASSKETAHNPIAAKPKTGEYRRQGESIKSINDTVVRVTRSLGKNYPFTVMKENYS
jgi:hypothetical protein